MTAPTTNTSRCEPLDVGGLARRVVSCGSRLQWLAGAGVSFSAGVPTAMDLTHGFKRTLYAQAVGIDVDDLDPTDPDVRLRFDAHFATEGLPGPGDPEEYAVFFERLHPTAVERQRAIARVLDQAAPAPNLGHVVLALLWRRQLARVVWTTNFDDVLEQAAALVSGAPRWLRRVDRTEPGAVGAVFDEATGPLLVKLHGDFQSARLDNTVAELAADSELRAGLAEAMRTKGLVVVGYSGRDASVMDALTAALDAPAPYPHGLYWITRPGEAPLPAVTRLLDRAAGRGVDARLVSCSGFEELMVAVRRLLELDDDQRALLDRFRPRHLSTPFRAPAASSTRWPKIRLNAIAVTHHPQSARLLRSTRIDAAADAVAAAVDDPALELTAVPARGGVLAFGPGQHLRIAFTEWQSSIDTVALDPGRSPDLGLLYEALLHALARDRPLCRQGRRTLTVDHNRTDHPGLQPLQAAGPAQLAGTLGDPPVRWAEAIDIALQHRHGTPWLIYTPTVWTEPDHAAHGRALEWARRRQASRHNAIYTTLLKAWADLLCGSAPRARLAFPGAECFELRRVAPYAERTKP